MFSSKNSSASVNDEGFRVSKARTGKEELRKTFIPDLGEFIFTDDTNNLYIGDGKTLGGVFIAGNITQELLNEILNDDSIVQNIMEKIEPPEFNLDIVDGGKF